MGYAACSGFFFCRYSISESSKQRIFFRMMQITVKLAAKTSRSRKNHLKVLEANAVVRDSVLRSKLYILRIQENLTAE